MFDAIKKLFKKKPVKEPKQVVEVPAVTKPKKPRVKKSLRKKFYLIKKKLQRPGNPISISPASNWIQAILAMVRLN